MYVRIKPPPRRYERLAKTIGAVISSVGILVIMITIMIIFAIVWKKIF